MSGNLKNEDRQFGFSLEKTEGGDESAIPNLKFLETLEYGPDLPEIMK